MIQTTIRYLFPAMLKTTRPPLRMLAPRRVVGDPAGEPNGQIERGVAGIVDLHPTRIVLKLPHDDACVVRDDLRCPEVVGGDVVPHTAKLQCVQCAEVVVVVDGERVVRGAGCGDLEEVGNGALDVLRQVEITSTKNI